MIDITFKGISIEALEKIAAALAGPNQDGVQIQFEEETEKPVVTPPADHASEKKPASATTATAAAISTPSQNSDLASVKETCEKPVVTPPAEEKPVVTPPAEEKPPSEGSVRLDLKKTPWDERIHSKNKSMNQDGSWRYKQGVDRQTLVPQVEAEIRGTAAPSNEISPEQIAAAKSLFDKKPVVTPPATEEVTPAATEEVATETKVSFIELMPMVTDAVAAGTITIEKSTQTLALLGVEFTDLSVRPDLIKAYMEGVGL